MEADRSRKRGATVQVQELCCHNISIEMGKNLTDVFWVHLLSSLFCCVVQEHVEIYFETILSSYHSHLMIKLFMHLNEGGVCTILILLNRFEMGFRC